MSGWTAFELLRQSNVLARIGTGALAATIACAAQVIAVLWLVFKLEAMPAVQTKMWFIGYSVLSGVSLPRLFLFFTQLIFLSLFLSVGRHTYGWPSIIVRVRFRCVSNEKKL
jgi:FtsH-binding integral membrane protein